eukprot:TRINITY_DN49792_c0_g1_i1.p1 TRINITY_DN49792_c0_g1~~TRINITY_DN49792_c0_g1_i1.p1  ORF type:complete len:382 (-),score=79.60 TRINITY_DN49792_c0_g1_i1:148-1293(-)
MLRSLVGSEMCIRDRLEDVGSMEGTGAWVEAAELCQLGLRWLRVERVEREMERCPELRDALTFLFDESSRPMTMPHQEWTMLKEVLLSKRLGAASVQLVECTDGLREGKGGAAECILRMERAAVMDGITLLKEAVGMMREKLLELGRTFQEHLDQGDFERQALDCGQATVLREECGELLLAIRRIRWRSTESRPEEEEDPERGCVTSLKTQLSGVLSALGERSGEAERVQSCIQLLEWTPVLTEPKPGLSGHTKPPKQKGWSKWRTSAGNQPLPEGEGFGSLGFTCGSKLARIPTIVSIDATFPEPSAKPGGDLSLPAQSTARAWRENGLRPRQYENETRRRSEPKVSVGRTARSAPVADVTAPNRHKILPSLDWEQVRGQ